MLILPSKNSPLNILMKAFIEKNKILFYVREEIQEFLFSKVDRFIMRILEKTLNRKGYRLWRQCALSGYINLYNPSFVEFFTAALKTLTLQSKYLHHK